MAVLPQGGVGLGFLLDMWNTSLQVGTILGGIAGGLYIEERIRRRFRRSQDAIGDPYASRWQIAFGRPQDLLGLLERAPRDGVAVGQLLGVEPATAEAFLEWLGCVKEGDRWRLPTGVDGVDARVQYETLLEIGRRGRALTREECADLVKRVVDASP